MKKRTKKEEAMILDRCLSRELRKLYENFPTWGQSAVASVVREDSDLFKKAIVKAKELRTLLEAFPSQEEVTKIYNQAYGA